MIIKTKNLKQFKKTFDVLKDNTSPFYEFVYLDFEKEKLIFRNERVVVSIDLELEEKTDEKNFYVSGSKLFFIISSYDKILLKDEVFYSTDSGKFKIPTMKEEGVFPYLEDYEYSIGRILFNSEFQKELRTASDFLDKEETSPFSALFFEKGRMFAISPAKFFNSRINDLISFDFYIPTSIVRLFYSLDIDEEVEVKKKKSGDGFVMQLEGSDFYIYFSIPSFELPIDPFSEDFKESFFHENTISFPRNELFASIKFLNDFLKDSKGSYCRIKFSTREEKAIEFYLPADGEVYYKAPVSFSSDHNYFNNKELWISLLDLRTIVNSLKKEEDIIMRYEQDAPSVMFYQDEDLFIVQTLIEDPTA
jgi:hypothetical protein